MKNSFDKFVSYIFPKTDKKTKREIETQNIKTLHCLSLTVGIIQSISLIVYYFTHIGAVDGEIIGALVRVGLSIVLCLYGYIVSGILMKMSGSDTNRPFVSKAFVYSFIVLLIVWSMFVSVNNYINNQQLLTFYTVELLAVLFVKLNPVFSSITIFSSYLIHYLILNYGYISGRINPYNYAMLAVLSIIGAVVNYRLTVNYISEKNKAKSLNDSLEIIANHDSLTRLQNRYALNQCVPDFLKKDICIAIGDINRFKLVNDTYGHIAGDDVLNSFSNILLKFFPRNCLFRYGGDEFLIVEPGKDIKAVNDRLGQVNEEFCAKRIQNVEIELSCSFGCVFAHPDTPAEFFEAVERADKLLYDEKMKFTAK